MLGGITRRGFLLGLSAAGFVFTGGGAAYASTIEPRWVELTRRTIRVPGWPAAFDPLRVAHLTDLHHSPAVPMPFLKACFARVNAERPDLVALTGDYITHGADKGFIEAMAEAVGLLAAPLGTFAVLGNHDAITDGARVRRALARHGCRALQNESVDLVRVGGRLPVIGLGDLLAREFDPAAGFHNVSPGGTSLVLMHNPDPFEEWPVAHQGLILAGHTHGGQLAIPGFGPPYVPSRYGRKYSRGLFRKPQAAMYVNRGLGVIHLRVRLFARPEIAILTIRSA